MTSESVPRNKRLTRQEYCQETRQEYWPLSSGPLHIPGVESRMGANAILSSSTVSSSHIRRIDAPGSGHSVFGTRMSLSGVPMRTPNPITCFDDSKMTRNSVAYAHDALFRGPVDRIGMYLSPHALHLTMHAARAHIAGSAFSSPPPSRKVETGRNLYHEASEPTLDSKELSIEQCESFSRSRHLPLRMTDEAIPHSAAETSSHQRYRQFVESIDADERVLHLMLRTILHV